MKCTRKDANTIFVKGLTRKMVSGIGRAIYGTFYRVKGGIEWFGWGCSDSEFEDDLQQLKQGLNDWQQ